MTRIDFMQGNDACAAGALAAGCRFFAGYPITPSSEVAEYMARRLPKEGGTFIQMEDEIASMAAIIGGAWTGVRSMTATSGPGFSLMMENIGYAAFTETPCVIINVQRGGPSTGQPTMAAQGDMLQSRFGSHGDYSVIALTPSTVQEMFNLTVKAFNLADRFRVPTFLMADEIIGHLRERVEFPDTVECTRPRLIRKGMLPFEPEDDLVPGFTPFGHGHRVHVTGLTHNEQGYPASTDPDLHEKLIMRLIEKVERARHEIADYDIVNPDAEIVFISYGAPTRAVRQALLDAPDDIYGHLNLRVVWPFPEGLLKKFTNARVFLVPEMNMGQIAREIERHVHQPVVSIPRLGGELHIPASLLKRAEEYR